MDALRHKSGQSLIEALVSIAIGVTIVVGSISLIAFALRSGKDADRLSSANVLGKELLDQAVVISESSWRAIAQLSTSSAFHYHVDASSSPFSVVAGDENVVIQGVTYTRYFYVDEVARDGNGYIVAEGGVDDPSTRKITVLYSWSSSPVRDMVIYVTRWRHRISNQTDWFGGSGEDGPLTSFGSQFSTSTNNVNYSTSTGSIELNVTGGGGGGGDPWCNDTTGVSCTSVWRWRKKVTFNNSASAQALSNFPVLIQLSSSNIDWIDTQNSGQDIRFVDPSDNTTALDHEIEIWDEAGNTARVWVRVPSLAAGSADYIWMYYNNGSAADGQNPSGVWDSNFVGTWHVEETVTDEGVAADVHTDSTSNANHFDQGGNDDVTAKIHKGQDFEGTNDFIQVGDVGALDGISRMTVSSWVKTDAMEANDTVVSKFNSAAVSGWRMGIHNSYSSGLEVGFSTSTAGTSWQVPVGVTSISVKSWGGGGGGGGASSDHSNDRGENGGGGGYASTVGYSSIGLPVTPLETLTIRVGGGGGGGNEPVGDCGVGGGGGGYSGVFRSGTPLIVAGAGGGGGGGHQDGSTGGAGGAGGGIDGIDGTNGSAGAGKGFGGTQASGGNGGSGTGGENGEAGVSYQGGRGGDIVPGNGAAGGVNGGNRSGGFVDKTECYDNSASGGGGGGGYMGGGGGEGAVNPSGGGGGGGGSAYDSTGIGTLTAGSGRTPGNDGDPDKTQHCVANSGTGGVGGHMSNGTPGIVGCVVLIYDASNDADALLQFDTSQATTSARGVLAETWQHWAMSFDGTVGGNPNRLKFYINGVSQSLTFQGPVPATTPNTSYAVRAAATADGTDYVNGVIDEVRIANTARSADYIEADYLFTNDNSKYTYGAEEEYFEAASGTLFSSILDTGVTNGAKLNFVLWEGDLPAGTSVWFQFAGSNSSSGPWNYMGPDGTANTYYGVSPNVSQPLNYNHHNDQRFYRYRVVLYSDEDEIQTPRIENVIISWSP